MSVSNEEAMEYSRICSRRHLYNTIIYACTQIMRFNDGTEKYTKIEEIKECLEDMSNEEYSREIELYLKVTGEGKK